MARIRTIKPEFWEDEIIGTLSREARLLFLACLNLADDEGLLRWNPEFLKAQAFIYDDDIGRDYVQRLMAELEKAELVCTYNAGKVRQHLGWIVTFRRHQVVNRPQRSKLPSPPLDQSSVRRAFMRRDKATCQVCRQLIREIPDEESVGGRDSPSTLMLDHLIAESEGGSSHPSNVRCAHQACVKRRLEPNGQFKEPNRAEHMPDAVNDSVNHSAPEGEQGSRNRDQGSGNRDQEDAAPEDLDRRTIEVASLYPKIKDAFHLPRDVAEVIAAAIARDGRDAVWTGTKSFKEVTDRWPVSERQFIPSPQKFYRESKYLTDPREWERSSDARKRSKADQLVEKQIANRNAAIAALGMDH